MISGFLVAWGGMVATLVFALAFTLLALRAPRYSCSSTSLRPADATDAPKRVDIAGTIRVVAGVSGLFALILFASFNNFLGGIFMALMDAYGLSLMAVRGLGPALGSRVVRLHPERYRHRAGRASARIRCARCCWSISSCGPVAAVFTIQSSIPLLAAGCVIWMFLGPYAEAAEQTTLQKVVPYERQGRVFGFAQSVEQAASPLTAFLIAPLAQFVFIPFMTTGAGAGQSATGSARGPERGIALVFVVAGLLGVLVTIAAFNSRYYRELSAAYAGHADASSIHA